MSYIDLDNYTRTNASPHLNSERAKLMWSYRTRVGSFVTHLLHRAAITSHSNLPTLLSSILMQVLHKVKESEHELQVNVAGNQDWTKKRFFCIVVFKLTVS